ncbi:unnamed protein product [Onchocerca flexuosa]|uniref:Ovule protein n=1 Tax=Onchocerca flexuosa TaxID=387005 RepID=A0A183HNZ7_9BILA|nr:unnamed protein product [Onchocerca flexuosa]
MLLPFTATEQCWITEKIHVLLSRKIGSTSFDCVFFFHIFVVNFLALYFSQFLLYSMHLAMKFGLTHLIFWIKTSAR